MTEEPDYCCIAGELISRAYGEGSWMPDDPSDPLYDIFLGMLMDVEHHLRCGRIVVLQKNASGYELRAYEPPPMAKSQQAISLYDLRQT